MNTATQNINLSKSDLGRLHMAEIIEIIRQGRNRIINSFLHEKGNQRYLTDYFKKEVSSVKLKFILLEFSELLESPVDLSHYSHMILQIAQSNEADTTIEQNSQYFYKEVDCILEHYIY